MNKFTSMHFVSLLAMLILVPSYGDGKDFKASVVKIDVTPGTPQKLIGYGPRISTGVHDRIYHRILAMDDGENQAFMTINGDTAIWTSPLELFCEISNEIRGRSPFLNTLYFGYTNGWLGYMLTESEYEQGGYEAGVSPFAPSAARDLIEAVSAYLDGETKE